MEMQLRELDPKCFKQWQILYCGGVKQMVEGLENFSADYGIVFRKEAFDW